MTHDDANHDDLRTDTAQRPAVHADVPAATSDASPRDSGPAASDDLPPPSHLTPAPARYPLFADESPLAGMRAEPAPEEPALSGTRSTSVLPGAPAPALPDASVSRPRRRRTVWIATGAALVLVAGIGGVILLGGLGTGDDDVASDPARSSSITARSETQEADAAAAKAERQAERRTQRRAEKRAEAKAERRAEKQAKRQKKRERRQQRVPADVAQLATAVAPVSAPPSRDVDGNAVRYGSFNLLDGVSSTAWRMPGDGAGRDIVLRLAEPTKLREVGLINGYAKQEPGYDGYAANRRVERVQWTFDNGSTVTQDLASTTSMQTIEVPKVTTSSVTLRMLDVSRPGGGKSGRDYTAISDVTLVGTAA